MELFKCEVMFHLIIPKDRVNNKWAIFCSVGTHHHPPPPPTILTRQYKDWVKGLIAEYNNPIGTTNKFLASQVFKKAKEQASVDMEYELHPALKIRTRYDGFLQHYKFQVEPKGQGFAGAVFYFERYRQDPSVVS
jgi:hypothetical protein